MAVTWVTPGDNYDIDIPLHDGTFNGRITGLSTLAMSIERLSDGHWWNGSDFQLSYVTVDASELTTDDAYVGVYRYTFAVPSGDEEYKVYARYASDPIEILFYEFLKAEDLSASGTIDANVVQISGDTQAADDLEAMLDGTGGVTIDLEKVTVAATGSDNALTLTGSGTGAGLRCIAGSSNGEGIKVSGDGSGAGIEIDGGVTGPGVDCRGGVTSGDGMRIGATGGGDGIQIDGIGTGHGIRILAGSSGTGILSQGRGSGPGIHALNNDTGPGFEAGAGSGNDIIGTVDDHYTLGLDHLLAAAVGGSDVVDDSVVAQIASMATPADWDTFENTTESLEAIVSGTVLSIQEVLSRIGAVSGSGDNTLLGLLRALGRKDAALPSDMGGTYDVSTDSQQALYDLLGGSGFATGTHSLVAIVNLFNSTVAPTITATTASSDILSGSFLSRLIESIRRHVDEPSINSKYNDNDLIAKIKDAWSTVWVDVNLNSEFPILVRYDITVVANQQEYTLPPTVGQVWRWAKIEADTDAVIWEMDPESHYNPQGEGFRLEGNTIRLERKWRAGDTLRLEYVPNGEIAPMTGQWNSMEAFTDTSVTLASTVTNGVLDSRPNAYAGYMFRTVIAAGTAPVADDATTITQERLITAYDPITRVATLATALDPDISLGSGETLDYEIIPFFANDLEQAVAIRAAIELLSMEGNVERYTLQLEEYKRRIRTIKLRLASQQVRRASKFEGDVVENKRFPRMRTWPK